MPRAYIYVQGLPFTHMPPLTKLRIVVMHWLPSDLHRIQTESDQAFWITESGIAGLTLCAGLSLFVQSLP